MRKYIRDGVRAFVAGSVVLLFAVLGLIFASEQFSGAKMDAVENILIKAAAPPDNSVYVSAIERLRIEYSNINTVELDADVTIQIFRGNSTIVGSGLVTYRAQGNKYKYACSISDNLRGEGLMRNVDVLFDGAKFYFYDHEAKIVSFQSSEEVRLPTALPNPFFLPLDFLGTDDDSCEGCKMRLQDVNQPLRWPKRSTSISEISAENNNGVFNNLIKMNGGTLDKVTYDFRVRMVGEPQTMQPVSVARVKTDGSPLVEILSNDLRNVPGIGVKIPYLIEVGARDETGKVVLRAVYTIKNLKINQTLANDVFAQNFAGAEQRWDSDAKAFVKQ